MAYLSAASTQHVNQYNRATQTTQKIEEQLPQFVLENFLKMNLDGPLCQPQVS